ncbi:MAG: hypothetical protein KatS3mg102_1138 [Planctomycetota bacterium]|nr:MAG: hypothetical protein KatS3mg102_1138 [Planctomycetota bacterium]
MVRLLELGLVERRFPLRRVLGTVQRELGERLAAPPGDRRGGPATVLVQALAAPRLVRRLGAGAFWPPPEVDSVVLRLEPLPVERRLAASSPAVWQRFAALVRGLYRYRRKSLRQALGCALPGTEPEAALRAAGLGGRHASGGAGAGGLRKARRGAGLRRIP